MGKGKGNGSFCSFPSGPLLPSHCFLKHQNNFKPPYAEVHAGTYITQRRAKCLCSRVTQVWFSSTLPASSSCFSSTLFLVFLCQQESLGLKGLLVTGRVMSAMLGNSVSPGSATGQTIPHIQTSSRRRKQAQSRAVAQPDLQSLGILPLSSVIFQGSHWPILLAH